MKMLHKLAAAAAGIAVAGIYCAVKGKGIFNRPRFAQQHDAIERYIEAKHKNAAYSPIEEASNGWCTLVTEENGSQFMLYMTCSPDGVYVFHEERV